ncbi:MAG: AI-2E family transporter [Actinomycetota bacterium]|nr:AI-2E family transporter [Actinomycetota bacterium]
MNDTSTEHRRIHPVVERVGAYAWRLVAIGLAVAGIVWLTGELLVVVVPIAVAALLARALDPVASRLCRRGWKPALAAAVTLVAFLVVLFGVLGLAGATVARELDELGPTLSEGLDDLTDWLVEDSPFDVSRADVARWRDEAGETLSGFLGSGNETVVTGATIAAEVVVGSLLMLIIAFFFLKEGRTMVNAGVRAFDPQRRDVARRAAGRAWSALGGYLQGAALLGVVEAVAIGVTLILVGSSLVAPVILVTFLAAFVPIVGAVAAGIVAVLVALATAGTVPALIVAAVVIVVQQLDNDLLAPVIYGRALRLHPLVILLGIAAGGSLFGFVGTIFAVPFLAVTLNVLDEVRSPKSS